MIEDTQSDSTIGHQRKTDDKPQSPDREGEEKQVSLVELAKQALDSGDLNTAVSLQEEEITRLVAKNEKLLRQMQELARKSMIDNQTGLFNKNAYLQMLYPAVMRSFRTHEPLGVMGFDIQGLKKINDQRGHTEGDIVIANVGEAIREIMQERKRESDMAFRPGGDEMVLLLPDTDLPGVARAAQDFCNLFTARGLRVSIGAGVIDATDLNSILKSFEDIDQSQYASKAEGHQREAENPDEVINNVKIVGQGKPKLELVK